ncbi:hypothetical protein M1403_02135 [Patescibacteria group bacterium]|nr:hypothetical protein [Patescibacteria group bacterium]
MDNCLLIKDKLKSLKSLRYPKKQKEILKLLVETAQLIRNSQELSPRRQEIFQTIQDHQSVSADFLHRRFLAVDPRLLRYDLKYLVDNGYIAKVGKTRGVLYTVSSQNP